MEIHHYHFGKGIRAVFCYIAEGEVLFLEEGDKPVHPKAGDMFAVASGKKYAIQLLTPTARMIDSFHPIREDFL